MKLAVSSLLICSSYWVLVSLADAGNYIIGKDLTSRSSWHYAESGKSSSNFSYKYGKLIGNFTFIFFLKLKHSYVLEQASLQAKSHPNSYCNCMITQLTFPSTQTPLSLKHREPVSMWHVNETNNPDSISERSLRHKY